MSKHATSGGDGTALLDLLNRLRAKAEQFAGRPVDIVVIQEAGLDASGSIACWKPTAPKVM